MFMSSRSCAVCYVKKNYFAGNFAGVTKNKAFKRIVKAQFMERDAPEAPSGFFYYLCSCVM